MASSSEDGLIGPPSNALVYWSIGLQLITFGFVYQVWQQTSATPTAGPGLTIAMSFGLAIMIFPLGLKTLELYKRARQEVTA